MGFVGRMVKATVNLTLLTALLIGGWWGYAEHVLKQPPISAAMTYMGMKPVAIAKNPTPAANQNPAAQPEVPVQPPVQQAPQPAPQQAELATSAPEYVVQIKSNPDRARVVINGEDTGEFTPMRKTLKANIPVNIRLVKEGYSDYVTTYTPITDVGSIDGTLQRLARLASLYVRIINGGANPELRISGIPVEIKPDTDPYVIQAEVNVKIQAKNKLTGLSAEKTVLIHADQKDIVELYLK
jgi:hypothetical protein